EVLLQRNDVEAFLLSSLHAQQQHQYQQQQQQSQQHQQQPSASHVDAPGGGAGGGHVGSDFRDLPWEDRERVLRLLFVKINNQAQQVHFTVLPPHPLVAAGGGGGGGGTEMLMMAAFLGRDVLRLYSRSTTGHICAKGLLKKLKPTVTTTQDKKDSYRQLPLAASPNTSPVHLIAPRRPQSVRAPNVHNTPNQGAAADIFGESSSAKPLTSVSAGTLVPEL
ncbi:hypothetical protein VOLCADRAFT_100702, partial [Volvox carteri f. nagariensis]